MAPKITPKITPKKTLARVKPFVVGNTLILVVGVLIIIMLFFTIWLLYQEKNTTYISRDIKPLSETKVIIQTDGGRRHHHDGDILKDPYVPPLQPIQTQPTQCHFYQTGILTCDNKPDLILPLMGRRIERQKWQYYTMSATTGNLHSKLPVRVGGRDGMQEYGVDEVSSRDVVHVDGYNDDFTVTSYNTAGYFYNLW
jgi:hypothetical protein